PFTPYTAYARVRALRVKRCAEHKQRNRDRRQNFQRFHFHRFVLRKISQLETQTDVCRGGFKKDLKSSSTIRPAFSILLSWYSFSKTRNLSSSIRRSNPRYTEPMICAGVMAFRSASGSAAPAFAQ